MPSLFSFDEPLTDAPNSQAIVNPMTLHNLSGPYLSPPIPFCLQHHQIEGIKYIQYISQGFLAPRDIRLWTNSTRCIQMTENELIGWWVATKKRFSAKHWHQKQNLSSYWQCFDQAVHPLIENQGLHAKNEQGFFLILVYVLLVVKHLVEPAGFFVKFSQAVGLKYERASRLISSR